MNKKFSTLMMAGMLVAGSSFVDAQTLNGLKLKQIDFQAGKEHLQRCCLSFAMSTMTAKLMSETLL